MCKKGNLFLIEGWRREKESFLVEISLKKTVKGRLKASLSQLLGNNSLQKVH